ncbi:UNVERIFIED_CONTAM: hypothetical protein Scaly_0680900 [Sesamum calycinum]|uniref:Uncharacterized protein n=1 Tax=Sesamum calycinum TaxID=2727403 RepID=A0AAW2R840_9LAMI
MYNKNLPRKAGLTPEFEDGVKAFTEWAKGQRRHMDGDKIRIIMRLLVSLKCRRSHMDWAQRMVFDAVRPSYFASSHEGVPDDGTRSSPVDAGTSSYVYGGGGPYNYDESRLAHRISNIVHAVDQPLWDGCNQSQLGVVAKLVDIKADDHISEQIYDRISKWANRILPSDHTLPRDYYSMKKLVKDLGLPIEKFHTCKNGCMLYWKDVVDLEY